MYALILKANIEDYKNLLPNSCLEENKTKNELRINVTCIVDSELEDYLSMLVQKDFVPLGNEVFKGVFPFKYIIVEGLDNE